MNSPTPALSLKYPYCSLVFRGLPLTRNQAWLTRGHIALCTALANDNLACKLHGVDRRPRQQEVVWVVGSANLVDCYPAVKREEKRQLFLQYNPHACPEDIHHYLEYDYVEAGFIQPGAWVFNLTNIHQFSEPIALEKPQHNAIYHLNGVAIPTKP